MRQQVNENCQKLHPNLTKELDPKDQLKVGRIKDNQQHVIKEKTIWRDDTKTKAMEDQEWTKKIHIHVIDMTQ